MSLYGQWIKNAYEAGGETNKKYWNQYMPLEQRIYEDLLTDGTGRLNMPLKEFAGKYGLKTEQAVGFLDGISAALKEEVNTEEIEEDFVIDIEFDYTDLFKKMAEYKAKHLYSLKAWDKFFDEETRENMVEEVRRSGTFISEEKPGRNEPCSCGSGKKYKRCCGLA